MGYGDEIMAAGHAQLVYDADPSKRVAICDRHGEPRWHPLWDGNPILATPTDVQRGEAVHRVHNAIGCRPYIRYPFTHDTGLRFTTWRAQDHPGRVYLTAEERARGARLRALAGPYVVIEPSVGRKSNQNKAWPFDRFQSVVTACPDVRFVQMRHPDTRPLAGPQAVVTKDFRDACAVLSAAEAYVGPEGGLHHAAAALGIPAVVVFGGCVDVRATGYPQHINLVDDGPETPCGRYHPCAHCRRAMERIQPAAVVSAIGRLVSRPMAETA